MELSRSRNSDMRAIEIKLLPTKQRVLLGKVIVVTPFNSQHDSSSRVLYLHFKMRKVKFRRVN